MFKNKKLRRVGITLFALIVTLAMTITSTYAWFTMSSSPRVEQFQLDVMTAGEMLMINVMQSEDESEWQAADAGWTNNVTSTNMLAAIDQALLAAAKKATYAKYLADYEDKIKSLRVSKPDAETAYTQTQWEDDTDYIAGGGDLAPYKVPSGKQSFKMGATTTIDGLNFTRENRVAVAPNLSPAVDTLGEGGYVQFQINFRANTSTINVVLDGESKVSTPGSTLTPVYGWGSGVAYDNFMQNGGTAAVTNGAIANGAPVYTSAAHAARYSFYDRANDTTIASVYSSAYNTFISNLQAWDTANNAYSTYTARLAAWTARFTEYKTATNQTSLTEAEYAIATGDTKPAEVLPADADPAGKTDYNTAKGNAAAALPKIWIPSAVGSVVDNRASGSISGYHVFNNSDPNNFANDYRNYILGTNVNYAKGSAYAIKTNGVTEDTTQLFTAALAAGTGANSNFYFGSLTVSIWLEGWDANCTNSIFNDQIISSLVFKGVQHSA